VLLIFLELHHVLQKTAIYVLVVQKVVVQTDVISWCTVTPPHSGSIGMSIIRVIKNRRYGRYTGFKVQNFWQLGHHRGRGSKMLGVFLFRITI
jgi:hypothetical protein